MIWPIGPIDKWEHDLAKMSRAALVEVVTELQWRLQLSRDGFDRESMAELLATGKQRGRWANLEARHKRFMADPDKAADQYIRRQKSAKAAARRKKRAAQSTKRKQA